VLVPSGNPLIIGAILPPVILAVAIAFSRSLAWIMVWAGICIVLQLLEQWLTWHIQRRTLHQGNASRDIHAQSQFLRDDGQPEAGLIFYTDAPDYSHGVVLHSNWWRRTTAEALMIGRPAYGYLIWQHDDQQALSSLLNSARPVSKPGSRLSTDWLHRHSRADQN